MSTERSVSRDGDKVYLDEENDGWTYMNRGPKRVEQRLSARTRRGFNWWMEA
jgi:hypothetical protein